VEQEKKKNKTRPMKPERPQNIENNGEKRVAI
jgi:hypothetical protein